MQKKILIVEDEALLLDALRDKLTREGFEIKQSKNGQEGLTMAFEQHPDLILLDIMMPEMGGMEMLKELRESQWGKTAKVILLTNVSDFEKVKEGLDLKVTDYLVKSNWDIDALVKKIREKLGEISSS